MWFGAFETKSVLEPNGEQWLHGGEGDRGATRCCLPAPGALLPSDLGAGSLDSAGTVPAPPLGPLQQSCLSHLTDGFTEAQASVSVQGHPREVEPGSQPGLLAFP